MKNKRIFSLITTVILTVNLFVGITPASAKTENIKNQMEEKLKGKYLLKVLNPASTWPTLIC